MPSKTSHTISYIPSLTQNKLAQYYSPDITLYLLNMSTNTCILSLSDNI